MTDQPDDTLLDDDVGEHEFNFDNEKEDALLAETDFDNFIDESSEKEATSSRKELAALNSSEPVPEEDEQLDQEEDVLDIGIADEDIVEADAPSSAIPYTNVITKDENVEPSENSSTFIENDQSKNSKSKDEPDTVCQPVNDAINISTTEDVFIENNESVKKESPTVSKSKVISLKKNDVKSYDDLPDLNKVIEQVQPSGPFRLRRHVKNLQLFQKKNRFSDGNKTVLKRNDFVRNDESGAKAVDSDMKFKSNFRDIRKNIPISNDVNFSQRRRLENRVENVDIVNRSHQISNNQTFRNTVTDCADFPRQLLPAPTNIQADEPILTTVQITQERYQIAADDFPIVQRDPQNCENNFTSRSNVQSVVRPFVSNYEPVRSQPCPRSSVPYSGGNFPPPRQSFPPNLSENFRYRPRFTPPVSQYSSNIHNHHPVPRLAPSFPPPPHPSAVHSLPPVSTQGSLSSFPLRQKFPPPLQNRAFSSPFSHTPSFTPQQQQQQHQHRSRTFSSIPTGFPPYSFRRPLPPSQQPFNHPPPPFPPIRMQNGSQSRLPLTHIPAEIPPHETIGQPAYSVAHQGRPPPAHSFGANSINSFQSSIPPSEVLFNMNSQHPRSIVFQQTQRVIQMPSTQNFATDFSYSNRDGNDSRASGNHENRGDNTIGMSHCATYYMKESIISSSSAVTSNVSCLPTSNASPSAMGAQPPPPGIFAFRSTPGVFTDNNPAECARSAREEYQTNQPGDRQQYLHSANANYVQTRQLCSNDRTQNFQYSKRTATSPVDSLLDDAGRMKQMRRDYSTDDKKEEDEMEAYRKKVEHQKTIREKFVQMKEEQRLKNQMQNFIQNNIKGILQKREQFLRKHEMENNPTAGSFSKKKYGADAAEERKRSDDRSSGDGKDCHKNALNDSLTSKRHSRRDTLNVTRTSTSDEGPGMSHMKHFRSTDARLKDERLNEDISENDENSNTKELHKVVKIKYKDGTIALRSFPVMNTSGKTSSTLDQSSSHDISNLNVTIRGEDTTTSCVNRRRMVVSKLVSPSNIEKSLQNDSLHGNENIIIESVRMGISQSSLPLAERFKKLKSSENRIEDETEKDSLKPKTKNRLVIPEDEEMRTVWVRNISSSTRTTVIRKMADICGSVTRMRWITGRGKLNQAKITFGRTEDAKAFIDNYDKKLVDSSSLAVTLISENQ